MGTRRVITPEFRCSYMNLREPRQNEKTLSWSYGLVMIFDEAKLRANDEEMRLYKDMMAIVEEAIKEKWKDSPPSYITKPFRRGEQKSEAYPRGYDLNKNPEYKGHIIVSANGYTEKIGEGRFNPEKEIGIVGPDGKKPMNPSDIRIYSGMYGRAEISAYVPKDHGQGPQVVFGLHNFQKTREGEPLGGGTNGDPESAFTAFVSPEAQGMHDDLLGV